MGEGNFQPPQLRDPSENPRISGGLSTVASPGQNCGVDTHDEHKPMARSEEGEGPGAERGSVEQSSRS